MSYVLRLNNDYNTNLMVKITTLLLSFCMVTSLALSQSNSGTITGKLIDSETKDPVALATIAVYRLQDSSLITYRLSDPAGVFRVPGLPFNDSLRIVITRVGSAVYRHNFLLTKENHQLSLDTISMIPEALALDEVLIIAEAPPIIVKNDTIEFNASSFKTLPSALVEDLLRKLPGVDVDGNGNIIVNGRKVNKLYVDGKEFFGSDPQMATKNLPANVIDKIQVTDDKEQIMRNPDLPKGQIGQVINLTLKKAIKKGWFGKAYAGAGTDERREAGGIFNIFRDTLQVSILGYTNNMNKSGFGMSDVMNLGGFSRSGTNSMMVMSDGGFALNNISFGGTGSGIQRSTGAGTNINHQLRKNLSINFQYFFGQIKSDDEFLKNTRQFFQDTILTIRNQSIGTNTNNNHRIGGYMKWAIDSTSRFEFRPTLGLNNTRDIWDMNLTTTENYQGLKNENRNKQLGTGNGVNFSQDISYYKNYKKKGRSLYTSVSFNLTGSNNEKENNAISVFYNNQQGVEAILNQLRKNNMDNYSFRANINYSEPLSKSFALRISETLNSFNDKNAISTFLDANNDHHYIIPDPTLTDVFRRSGIRNTTGLSLRYKYKSISLEPGLSYQMLDITNRFLKMADIPQRFNYILPSLSINIKDWSFRYSASVNEPPANDLQPVEDNTNPLFIRKGNPDLKPAISHYISMYKSDYNMESNFSYDLNIYSSIQNSAVIYARTVDNHGVQITTPINADGSGSGQISASIRKQFKFRSDWKLSTGLSAWTTYSRQLFILNQKKSYADNWTAYPRANISFNWKDAFELRQDLGLWWQKSDYSNDLFPSIQSTSYFSTSEVIVRAPKKWVWESSIDYRHNPLVGPGFQKDVVRWNAGINFLFMKDDRAQLKLSVFDLLNQNKQVYRQISENQIIDDQSVALQRYFMLTFTYNFRQFGGKVGGRERFFLF